MSTIKVGDRVSAGFAIDKRVFRQTGVVVSFVGDYLLSIKLDEPIDEGSWEEVREVVARTANCFILKGATHADVHCERAGPGR